MKLRWHKSIIKRDSEDFSVLLLLSVICTISIFALNAAVNCVRADNNSFFGANANGAGSGGSSGSSGSSSSTGGQDYSQDLPEDSNPNAGLPGLNSTTPNTPSTANAMSGDFTGDEKRMQKKYRDNVNNAKSLIAKGERMMKDADNDQKDANYKKGKILKEIGEKTLAELKANNPFPNQKNK